MGFTERAWGAFTSIVKLEDKVTRQSEALKAQQGKIENLTERIIRLETALEIGLATQGAPRPAKRLTSKPPAG